MDHGRGHPVFRGPWAGTFRRGVVKLEIRRPQDIASSFESLKADALYVTGDALFNANRIRINTFSPPEWRAFLAVAGNVPAGRSSAAS
jgi:hypothetical protein